MDALMHASQTTNADIHVHTHTYKRAPQTLLADIVRSTVDIEIRVPQWRIQGYQR